jgi:hypothetical protein
MGRDLLCIGLAMAHVDGLIGKSLRRTEECIARSFGFFFLFV